MHDKSVTQDTFFTVEQFEVDLTSIKASIKRMIQKDLTKLADEIDNDDDGEVKVVKDSKPASATGVKV